MNSRIFRLYFGLAVLALALVVTLPHLYPVPDQSTANAQRVTSPQDRPVFSLRDLNEAFVEIAEKVKPTVVTVFTERSVVVRENPFMNPFFDFFGGSRRMPREREYRQQGLGSGVIVRSDGHILTNNHVIADADSIFVRTFDGGRYRGTVVGKDPKTDIAVIKIEADNLPTVSVGSSAGLRTGEMVLAIGSPMSENLAHTVTQGIVSATGRSNIGLADYEDFIQTDAAINPGNSGGALVNLDGELVGINTAILSRSGGFQGIGFAVPIDMAVGVMNSLLTDGRVVRGWLGVSIQPVSESIAEALDLTGQSGALIGDVVENGPAQKAGIVPGDIVLAINGRDVTDPTQLRNMVAAISPGSDVDLTLWRDGRRTSVTVTLSELPAEAVVADASDDLMDLLGFRFTDLTSDLAQQYDIDPSLSGVIVTEVDPASPAWRSGLREGDVISSVNRRPIQDAGQLSKLADGFKRGTAVLLRLVRDGSAFFVAFTLG